MAESEPAPHSAAVEGAPVQDAAAAPEAAAPAPAGQASSAAVVAEPPATAAAAAPATGEAAAAASAATAPGAENGSDSDSEDDVGDLVASSFMRGSLLHKNSLAVGKTLSLAAKVAEGQARVNAAPDTGRPPPRWLSVLGAASWNATRACGLYRLTEETQNDRPVWAKDGDPDAWFVLMPSMIDIGASYWCIGATSWKQKNQAGGLVSGLQAGGGSPSDVTSWREANQKGDGWTTETSIVVEAVDLSAAPPERFQVQGATSAVSERVNGQYVLTKETQNGRPVWQKDGDLDTWFIFLPSTLRAGCFFWCVLDTKRKQQNASCGWLSSMHTGGPSPPQVVGGWREGRNDGSGWDYQASLSVDALTPGPLPERLVVRGVPASVGGDRINGQYVLTEEMVNGRRAWSKDGDSDRWFACMTRGTRQFWCVVDARQKDRGELGDWLMATQPGGVSPADVTGPWTIARPSAVAVNVEGVIAVKAMSSVPPPQRLLVRGAANANMDQINGMYTQSEELRNGRPVWLKDGDGDVRFAYLRQTLHCHFWCITSSELQKRSDSSAWLVASQTGGSSPMEVFSGWREVSDDGARQEVASSIVVEAGLAGKFCKRCVKPYTGFGDICGGCRKSGKVTAFKTCPSCGAFYAGNGDQCDGCQTAAAGVKGMVDFLDGLTSDEVAVEQAVAFCKTIGADSVVELVEHATPEELEHFVALLDLKPLKVRKLRARIAEIKGPAA